jgi:membrane protease YdiL (CAAX protease family)
MDPRASRPDMQEQVAGVLGRRRSLAEIATIYALILAVEWTPRPWQRGVWVVAALGVALIVTRSFAGWRALGFRAANFSRALWIAGVALGMAAASVAVAAHMHTLRVPVGPCAFLATYFAYAIWSGVQQFLLQAVFLLRFLRILSKPALAALAASVLFSLAHLPNPILMPVTFVWGLAAGLLFLRYRNIYPLMIAHAILGITVAMTIPGAVDHNMRVGLGYLKYQPPSRTLHRAYR